MPDLWTPSDTLLEEDPIARQKIATPFPAPDLEAAGIRLPDLDDTTADVANELAAAAALAEVDDDDGRPDGSGVCADDDEVLDEDAAPIDAEV